ncbi:MAG: helix-turn-helix transcriptional regulator, partial [Chloroflexota bacterium]|nr:helix-turn-helix transcriptional regulator [Chloroflexota bacterium]
ALTRREREVLSLMVQGLTSDRELAEHLLVSPNTIKYHLKNLFSKLGVSSRAQLIARAASIGQR